MNSLFVFTLKELKEQIKTFKGIIIVIVLLLFGMTSPLLAKLTPEMLKMADLGVEIKIPDPTYIDAYAQFFKNMSQMVLIVVLLIYSNSVVNETLRGTAPLMLTKKLTRSAFIIAKFLSAAVVWSVSYVASALTCTLYTAYLFPNAPTAKLFLPLATMWLFGIITLAISILTSTIFKNYALAAVGGFCLWGLTLLTGSIPKIKDYSPAALASINVQLISGTLAPEKMLWPVLTGCIYTIFLIACACIVFRKREL